MSLKADYSNTTTAHTYSLSHTVKPFSTDGGGAGLGIRGIVGGHKEGDDCWGAENHIKGETAREEASGGKTW